MNILNKSLKKKADNIHKDYAVRMKGPNDIVVPQVLISNEMLGRMLEKDIDLQTIIRTNRYLSFYRTSKDPHLNKLPMEVIQYITSYLPIISKQMIAYCKLCFLEKTELQISNVISDNKFDILWYDFGSIDYTWASDTIKEATQQLEHIQTQKKLFLKNARYNP
jgi:hypothetical protein